MLQRMVQQLRLARRDHVAFLRAAISTSLTQVAVLLC